MIHTVQLSLETRARLSELVRLQMDLLWFAAESGGQLTEANLRGFLNSHTTRPPLEVDRIIRWVFYITSTPLALLNTFVSGTEGQSALYDAGAITAEKTAAVVHLRLDIGRLYKKDCHQSFGFYLDDNVLPGWLPSANEFLSTHQNLKQRDGHFPDWLKALRDFCIYFYNALDKGMSIDLNTRSQNITRETFFTEFSTTNPSQSVCAICDEHAFHTIARGKYLSDIEHYFPKSIYPHLACHPYNLIPICGSCNTIHLDRDPLKGLNNTRKNIDEIFLPYRSINLDKNAAMKVDLLNPPQGQNQPANGISSVVKFQLIGKDGADHDFQEKISAMGVIYDIPERWQGKADQIGDRLWQRILEYIDLEFQGEDVLDTDTVYTKLLRLLVYLESDLGKGPWAFANLWWLANLLAKEVLPVINGTLDEDQSPILVTIQDTASRNSKLRHTRSKRAQDILDITRNF